jgi:Spy/CpxP family protein refolding chaperone
MKKRIIIATVILTIAAVAIYAGPGRHMRAGHGMGHDGFGAGFMLGHLHRVAEELDLTEAQKTQIHAIVKETREENKRYREQLHGGFHSVAKALIENPNDVSGAQALLDQQSATERAFKSNIVRAASKALNVLTPEQRTKLAEIMAKRVEARENRRDRN